MDSTKKQARIAGLLYALVGATAPIGLIYVPGKLFVFADPLSGMHSEDGVTVIEMPAATTALQAPIVFAVPLQLLAYHVAVLKGTDVDQPRNLAKSLTVE